MLDNQMINLNKTIILSFLINALLFICCQNHKHANNKMTNRIGYRHDLSEIIETFKTDSLTEFFQKKSIPTFIISFLEQIQNEKLNIADTGKAWEGTDALLGSAIDTNISADGKKYLNSIIDSENISYDSDKILIKLPDKQLDVFSIGKQIAFISYRQGGFISHHHFYVFLIKANEITDYWYGNPVSTIENTKEALFYLERMKTRYP